MIRKGANEVGRGGSHTLALTPWRRGDPPTAPNREDATDPHASQSACFPWPSPNEVESGNVAKEGEMREQPRVCPSSTPPTSSRQLHFWRSFAAMVRMLHAQAVFVMLPVHPLWGVDPACGWAPGEACRKNSKSRGRKRTRR